MNKNNNHLGKIVNFNIKDINTLYKSYMPFVKNCGFFVPTDKPYSMGDELFVLLSFPGENKEKLPAMGKVVWVYRSGSLLKPSGVGIQFLDTKENEVVKDKIETLIAGFNQEELTYTM